ncbi:MAG: hypothetical protein WA975_23535 [Mesorhizobium sp.]
MNDFRDIDAAINALAAVKLHLEAYAKTPKAFEGIDRVLDSLSPPGAEKTDNIRAGVADAIRRHFGYPKQA